MELIWALTAFAGVALLGTLNGILVAVVVSLVALAQRTADPPVRVLGRKPGTNVFRPRSEEHPEDETFPGLLLLRPEGPVFFANVSRLTEKIGLLMEEAKPRVVALDLGGVPDIEYTGLKMLAEAEQRARESGVSVWLVGLNPEVFSVIQRSPARTSRYSSSFASGSSKFASNCVFVYAGSMTETRMPHCSGITCHLLPGVIE